MNTVSLSLKTVTFNEKKNFRILFNEPMHWLVCLLTEAVAQRISVKKGFLKVQSCKLYNINYMIASTQIANTEISAFI